MKTDISPPGLFYDPLPAGSPILHMYNNEIMHQSLEGLMLKLKLQYFGHLMRKADSSEKTLVLGKI